MQIKVPTITKICYLDVIIDVMKCLSSYRVDEAYFYLIFQKIEVKVITRIK